MGSKWMKAKLTIGLHTCVSLPRTIEDSPPCSGVLPDTGFPSPAKATLVSSKKTVQNLSTPTPASPRYRFSRSGSNSSKKICSICLCSMKRSNGQAIFTAECSHSFHFHCIASNVKHGNQICPICRAKWKEIPLQCPITPPMRPNINAIMTVINRLPQPRSMSSRLINHAPDPAVFNDDEELINQCEFAPRNNISSRLIVVKTFPEVSSVPRSTSRDNFSVLIRLKAAVTSNFPAPRASVDLVTVLDISGSMAGTKLALLKRAMGFVIQNLGSNDRLSVIAFSSTARRLFPLTRMSETGRQLALTAVNMLIANGGTNIAEGLRKGAKVLDDRKETNPVGSIILLSDGQDTYNVTGFNSDQSPAPNYRSLLPITTGFKIPVHAFGFGTDHDALSMHSISELSGGTYSFIETESVIQDAFAQCIGGILSVVTQDLRVEIECVDPSVRLSSVSSGNYRNRILDDGRNGDIDVGDLYADEERNFLVTINIPTEKTSLIRVKCIYKDPLTKTLLTSDTEEVSITRTESDTQNVTTSIEVDIQRNRLQAAEAMSNARSSAEQGDLAGAVATLENSRNILSQSVSCNDRVCIALDNELIEMKERMMTKQRYESTGRAYILSGLSSHSWQRATARGDSTESSSSMQLYQTPSMYQMITRSQTLLLGSFSGKSEFPAPYIKPR